MKKEHLKLLYNPFERIAGLPALGWGMLGLVASTVINFYSGFHYYGLISCGPAPLTAFWTYAAEVAAVWLVLALIFYIGGLLLSKSKIRVVDVFGTIAFAQLPMVIMNSVLLLPPMNNFAKTADHLKNLTLQEIATQPDIWKITAINYTALLFGIWALILMFRALKISCNLKGWRLWVLYLIGVIGGNILCRLLFKLFYL